MNEELVNRIQQYLDVGGFWNPECMEHDKVRDLLMDCRAAITAQQEPVANCEESWPTNRYLFKQMAARFGIELGKDSISDALRKMDKYASPSGVREGMLRAAEIVLDHYWDSLQGDEIVRAHVSGIVRSLRAEAEKLPQTHVMVPARIVQFLMGSAPIDGVWFGDKHPKEKGQFWWRERIRAAQEEKK